MDWSEVDDSERMSEGMSTRKVTALTGRVYSDNESCDKELDYDDLATSYKDLYVGSTKVCGMLRGQKKINSLLLSGKKCSSDKGI